MTAASPRVTQAAPAWPPARPFAVAGAVCVVAGGLVAAATAPAPSEHGSWAAAYLVLVAGVAQIALAVGQEQLAPRPPAQRLLLGELLGWNAGNAAVLAGTLLGVVGLVDAGGALLVVTLALMTYAVRGVARRAGWWAPAFRLMVLALLVSIPVGLVLAATHPAA